MKELAAPRRRLTAMRWCGVGSRWNWKPLLAFTACGCALAAAIAQTPVAETAGATGATTLDVTVLDSNGRPVRGLQRNDFALRVDQQANPLTAFTESSAATTPPAPVPVQEAGNYTDIVAPAGGASLNILLVDALNTPPKQQEALRQQVRDFVAHAPGTHLAIFTLGNKFIQLQGFNASPDALKSAMGHVLIPREPVLLRSHDGTTNVVDPGSGAAHAAANLGLYETDSRFIEALKKQASSEDRGDTTLNAFYMLARCLDALPGRKNLIWLSGTFPIDITGATAKPGLPHDDDEQLHETSALLAHARVALYPVELGALGATAASSSEQHTMESLAHTTGGRLLEHVASLSEALHEVTASTADSYTLTFDHSPAEKPSATPLAIDVELSGAAASRSLTLLYPHTLRELEASLAAQPAGHSTRSEIKSIKAEALATTDHQQAESSFSRLAVTRAAPEPAEILFSVRVRPASKTTDEAIVPGNSPDPFGRLRGPFRRFVLSIQVLPADLALTRSADDRWTDQVEFIALDYDASGKLFNADDRALQLNMNPETYSRFLHQTLGFRTELSAPVRSEGFLRVIVHDVSSNHYGVVEIPLAAVTDLEPDGEASAAPTAPPPPAAEPAATAPR